jgi:hypothetical protein
MANDKIMIKVVLKFFYKTYLYVNAIQDAHELNVRAAFYLMTHLNSFHYFMLFYVVRIQTACDDNFCSCNSISFN